MTGQSQVANSLKLNIVETIVYCPNVQVHFGPIWKL
jgi:hypothetical protein